MPHLTPEQHAAACSAVADHPEWAAYNETVPTEEQLVAAVLDGAFPGMSGAVRAPLPFFLKGVTARVDGAYVWRLQTTAGQVFASSVPYASEGEAAFMLKVVLGTAAAVDVDDVPQPASAEA